jgi:hypothetical protein
MSSLSTASKRNACADDEAISLSDTLIATSPLTQSSQSASVYRGSKGALHRKHANPRQIKEKDLTQDFIALCCDNSDDNFLAIMARYKKLDEGDAISKEQATGMLGSFYELGVRERMFREVFGIGSSRYSRIVSGAPPRSRGGKNVFTVDKIMLASLAEMVSKLPTEEGFPCGHRRMMTYCTDPDINTWTDLFEHYERFMKDKDIRKMGYSTFHNYVRKHHPDLRLKRLQEDVCDCCVTLKIGT